MHGTVNIKYKVGFLNSTLKTSVTSFEEVSPAGHIAPQQSSLHLAPYIDLPHQHYKSFAIFLKCHKTRICCKIPVIIFSIIQPTQKMSNVLLNLLAPELFF